MKNLWAAWRRDFILGPKEKGCVFCNRIKKKTDRENLILFRGKRAFVIMNKYPYNGGHLLIVPRTHKKDLSQLTVSESNDLFNMTRKAVEILKKSMPADGFNIGMNLGAVAGAGIRDHLHIHVVPRFMGDTSYMVIMDDVKVQSISLLDIYDLLKPKFDLLKGKC